MPDLLLPSLEIENFRAFKHLSIEKLGRVNLIVGENSVGKTCLLEAILLYANRPSPHTIQKLFKLRGESVLKSKTIQNDKVLDTISTLKQLFHNYELTIGITTACMGQEAADSQYTFGINYYTIAHDAADTPRIPTVIKPSELDFIDDVHLGLSVSGEQQEHLYSLDKFTTTELLPIDKNAISCSFVPCNGLDLESATTFWNAIVLTMREEDVLAALSLIIPDIQRISLVMPDGKDISRTFIGKLERYNEPVKLTNLGDGVTRALHISLALVNSANGILLIDEFDNGLHYSVQTELWRLIFRVAHELNIQVFATTHNWDCIKAFQTAAQEDQNEEAMLIRLQRDGDNITPVTYDERELMIATREHIEVR